MSRFRADMWSSRSHTVAARQAVRTGKCTLTPVSWSSPAPQSGCNRAAAQKAPGRAGSLSKRPSYSYAKKWILKSNAYPAFTKSRRVPNWLKIVLALQNAPCNVVPGSRGDFASAFENAYVQRAPARSTWTIGAEWRPADFSAVAS